MKLLTSLAFATIACAVSSVQAGTPPGQAVPSSRSGQLQEPVYLADRFTGTDAAEGINACLRAAAPEAVRHTCDARMFVGRQRMSETIEVLSGTTLLLPHSAEWCWNMTDGKSVGIQQNSSSQIIGPAVGGGGNNMLLLPCSSHVRMLALYATQDNPVSGGKYIYATGFAAQNPLSPKGTTDHAIFSKGLVYTRYLFDESKFERIVVGTAYGDAWHIRNVCCDTNFEDVQASSSYGPDGGTPLVVEGESAFSWSGSVNAPGRGHPNVDILAKNYQIDFWNMYNEYGIAQDGSLDTSVPVVRIAEGALVRFHGGVVSQNSAEKACVNDWRNVTLNNDWCHGIDSRGVVSQGIYTKGLTVGAGGITTAVVPAIASAEVIAPLNGVQHVTGVVRIGTIRPPVPMSAKTGGCLKLIADGAWSTSTSGNIANAITASKGTLYEACFDGSKFYIK